MKKNVAALAVLVVLAGCAMGRPTPAPIEERSLKPVTPKVAAVPAKALPAVPRDPRVPVVNALPEPESPLERARPLAAPEPDAALEVKPLDQSAAIARPPAAAKLLADAEVALQAGRRSEARTKLERALEVSPRDAELWFQLAKISEAEGNWKQVKALAERSSSLAATGSPLAAASAALQAKAVAALPAR